ncbi:MAG: NPCBM/NEW2 domain-containing protein, partial [Pirellulales bacterium]|nr:NPCBM/NEW2 domain-containing protein [Pirellulales bacterium]
MFCKNALTTIAFVFLFSGLAQTTALRAAEPAPKYLADELADHIVSVTQAWGTLGINTSAYNAPAKPMKLRIKDKNYNRGLGSHANGEIAVGLFGTFKTFEAEVGIQWQGGKDLASVIFQVYVDGQKRFESGVMREGDAPRKVKVPVEGAVELRLLALDAGDYITCDCANWADARLTPDPTVKQQPYVYENLDIGRFARVATWDPKQTEGTKAKRTQEFPAADVMLFRELLPETDGTYKVPVYKSGTGCIGLRWDQPRPLRSVSLKFADAKAMPDVKDARLQCWKGESIWQGKWHSLAEPITVEKDTWNCKINYKDIPRGTQKIRWILPTTNEPMAVKAVSAESRTLWPVTTLRLESEEAHKGKTVPIEVYNGEILKGDGKETVTRIDWNNAKSLELKVRFGITGQLKSGQTVLRFQYPESPFGVAVEDLLTNDCIYVPHAGLFVTRTPAPVTLAEYHKRIADKTTVLDAVRKLPDQSFPQALAKVHNPVQDLGPTMLSLAHDNRKFMAHRDGTISYVIPDEPDRTYQCVSFHVNMNKADMDLAQLRPMFGDGKPTHVNRYMDGGWLPIPVTVTHNGGLIYRQRTCVAPIDDAPRAGEPDWLRERAACVVEYVIENPTVAVADANLQLAFYENAKQNKNFKLEKSDNGFLVTGGDRLFGTIDTSRAGTMKAKIGPEGTVKFNGKLAPGVKVRLFACLPTWKTGRESAKILNGNTPWTDKVEAYWTKLFEPAMQIELPDKLLTNVIRASQLHCILAARNEASGARVSAWIGSDRYGPLESETHAVIRGMDMMGQADFARRGLEFLIHRFNKNGYLTTGYTIVGTGEHLWTLAE